MLVLNMQWVEQESYFLMDGSLLLRFEGQSEQYNEWCELTARVGVKWSVRQLAGRSLKVSYKQPVLLQHVGEWVDGSFQVDSQFHLLSDTSVQEINAWLKQEAIYKVEEEHAFN